MTMEELRKRQKELIQMVDSLAQNKSKEEILNANKGNIKTSSSETNIFDILSIK